MAKRDSVAEGSPLASAYRDDRPKVIP